MKHSFADRFPQRNTWVGLNAYTALAEGNNGASGVYNCKNGYLINKPVSTENNLDKNIGTVGVFAESIDIFNNGYARSMNRIYC